MKTIPVERDDEWTLNVFVGDQLLVTMDDYSEQKTVCQGWRWNQLRDSYDIKTSIPSYYGYFNIPMEDVKIILHPREERLLKQLEAHDHA